LKLDFQKCQFLDELLKPLTDGDMGDLGMVSFAQNWTLVERTNYVSICVERYFWWLTD
jgi:hypothetical protein